MPEKDFALPKEVNALIDKLANRAGSLRVNKEVRRELQAHFEDALEGVAPDEVIAQAKHLVAEFGDPRVLGAMIRRAKRRCRSPFEKFVAYSLKTTAAFTVAAVIAAIVQGRIAEREFRTGLAALEKEGLISDVSQLGSTRPAGTVFFNGPAEESATAFLLSLKPDPLFEQAGQIQFEELRGDLGDDLERARQALAPLRPLMDKARQAAALPPTPMDQVLKLANFDSRSRNTNVFPSLDLIRSFLLEACLHNTEDRTEDAMASLDTALQLSGHVRDFPSLIFQMVGLSMEVESFTQLAWVKGLPDFSDAVAQRFLPHAIRIESERAALSQALTAESLNGRRLFHSGFDFLSNLTKHHADETLSERASASFIQHLYFTPLFRFISAPDELEYFTRYYEMGKALANPYYKIDPAPFDLTWWKKLPRTRMLTRLIGRMDIAPDEATVEARAALAVTAIDIERYRKANGHYPPALDALESSPWAAARIDPFTGTPLVYEQSRDSFALHSIGPVIIGPITDKLAPVMRQTIKWGER